MNKSLIGVGLLGLGAFGAFASASCGSSGGDVTTASSAGAGAATSASSSTSAATTGSTTASTSASTTSSSSSSGGGTSSSSSGGDVCDAGCAPPAQKCCNSQCIPVYNDVNNCGDCGVVCTGDHPYCINGSCAANGAPCEKMPGMECNAQGVWCCGVSCCTEGQLCCMIDFEDPTAYPVCADPVNETCPVGMF